MSDAFEELINNNPEWKRHYELIRTLGGESERGMAVLVGAELDRALELVLHAYLAPGKARTELFSGSSPPLGTFSGKINLCRVLHLITDGECAALHTIRKIRNEFAHNPSASFANAQIRSWVNILKSDPEQDHKAKFEIEAAGLIASLETTAVDQAHGRVYEESYNNWYRRGADPDAKPFGSKEEAALAYQSKETDTAAR
ncbi:hypothetical protein [Bradyrhizobium sp. Ec3.3]|uniref:hypothetical protein n=1 Tax=Bradyrhizobium sp. Ec3.3 TaxID=189753 RepID=UPI00040920DF|nr:hypothetical protein [Bradyrhizobium sp. Ec3.3]